ncbi:MAG: 1-(5-phosphoribosyl)-5-[(5-phosphoribosylamino)methylideneamino] imidazole-4-carboxamide isomerase [Bacteroidia bacterium]|nr:1-(5-phosphoribosyl)-5-[(5-phosphoribosylamino)methylideneamino] imidazole-4-carboxamide isomerase [Bacteroidia bacterium]
MQLIAAIDVWEGKVVRLRQGDFSAPQEIHSNPLDIGRQLCEWGVRWWHVVDLMGAKVGQLQQSSVLAKLRQTFPEVKMNLAGGLRTIEDIRWGVSAGFDYLVIGSAAVERPKEACSWIESYGAQRFILAADLRAGYLAIRGWQTRTAIEPSHFFEVWKAQGIQTFLCTEVERDGTLSGPDIALYEALLEAAKPATIIASGGVRGPGDLQALANIGVTAVVVGKALYTDPQASEWISQFI